MIDWRDYKFVGWVGFCQYACVVIHSAFVDVVINPNLIPQGSPYCLKLAPKEYLKEFPRGLCFHLTLQRVFASQKRSDTLPPAVHEEAQLVAKNTIQTVIAWAVISCTILAVLVLLFAFDVSIPHVCVNVEVNATRIILETSPIRISSLQLSWKEFHSLNPLKVFYILFRCNVSVYTDGVSLKWTSVEGNIETGLTLLWNGLFTPLTSINVRQRLFATFYDANALSFKQLESVGEACARAMTVRVEKMTLDVEPNRIPASLYLTLKDVLSSHCTTNNKNSITPTKSAAMQKLTSEGTVNAIHRIGQLFGLPALLLCIRKVHISVTDLIPSIVHTVRIKDIQYQRTLCPSHEHATMRNGQLLEHMVRITSCDVFSTKYASTIFRHDGDKTSTKVNNVQFDRRLVYDTRCSRERLCSLRHLEAIVVALHQPLPTKLHILDTKIKIESMYVLPTAVSAQLIEEKAVTSTFIDSYAASAEAVTKNSVAMIVYNEFVSIFAC